MDLIALMACYAAGVIAVIFAARHPEAGFLTHLFAWLAGGYLSILFVATGLTTHALTPLEWTGQAETGPLTLLIMVLAMAAPFIVGWDHNGRNSKQ
jgi:hypothetical protein